jgi:hypothetical protein
MAKKHESVKEIKPSTIRYIKLGEAGEWEEECIEKKGTLKIGFRDANHAQCLAGKWSAIRGYYAGNGMKPGPSTAFANQIKEFYEADESVLWITFYNHRLWWCFSEPVITLLADNRKTRPAIGGWKCKSIDGNTLEFDHLSESLLKLRLYKGTICKVKESGYVLNKINGRDEEQNGRYSLDLSATAMKLTEEGYFSPSTLQDERQRRLRELVERRGQPDFRNKLIAAYGHCAVTGCDAVAALEAAHIVPYCGAQSNHVSNGLLLRADIHTLFDLDLLCIDPKRLAVVLGPALKKTIYKDLNGKRLLLPAAPVAHPNKQALAVRWKRFTAG